MRGRLNRVGWWAAVGLLAPLLAPLAVVAGDNSWNNSAGGLWQDAGNWSAGAAPSDTFTTIWITNSPAKTVAIDHNTAAIPGVMTITNLTLLAPPGSVNTLLVANANDGGNLLIPGTGDTTTNWLDPEAIITWPARFYRIRQVP